MFGEGEEVRDTQVSNSQSLGNSKLLLLGPGPHCVYERCFTWGAVVVSQLKSVRQLIGSAIKGRQSGVLTRGLARPSERRESAKCESNTLCGSAFVLKPSRTVLVLAAGLGAKGLRKSAFSAPPSRRR